MAVWSFDAIGTRWEIETDAALPGSLQVRVQDEIEAFDRAWSRFRADSEVTALAARGGVIAAPPDAVLLLDAYRALSRATCGAVNPLIGDSLSALGYDAAVSLVPDAPRRAPADWEERLRWSDDAVSVDPAGMIDVGAIGKGRLVDRVLAVLEPVAGRVIVDASGDLATRGAAVRVALEHPYDAASAIGVVTVQDAALCASAINRRVWGDGLHHVLDGRTGLPVHTWAATWAIAHDAMTADAIATALFFDGGVELAARWSAAWVRMSTDGRVQQSPGGSATLFRAGARPERPDSERVEP